MRKLLLEVEDEYDFEAIGISAHVKDYRFCFELNKLLEIDLQKQADLEINNGGIQQQFSFFNAEDPEELMSYSLLNNRSEKGHLLPEQSSMDFILVVKGQLKEDELTGLNQRISSLKHTLTSVILEVESLKNKANLIF